MLLQAYFEWMDSAPAPERAQAVQMLAQAYLAGAYGGERREDMEAALHFALDDRAIAVRRALAMQMAERADAPRTLVLSLSRDQAEVSAVLIARSPLLTEADLIDLSSSAERLALAAIALRRDVTCRISAAIIARGQKDVLHALLRNIEAEISASSLIDLAGQHAEHAFLREALLARPDLPAEARHLVMRAVAQDLKQFLGTGGFLNQARLARLSNEALESGTIAIAAGAGVELPEFVEHLRARAELTPALLLRAVLEGDTRFMGAALAQLCDLPLKRVESLIVGRSDAALGALVRRAGLPDFLTNALIAALSAAVRLPRREAPGTLSLPVIRAAQSAIFNDGSEASLRLLALLRRYEADAARHAARALAQSLRRRDEREMPLSLTAPSSEVLRLESARQEPMFEDPAPAICDVEAAHDAPEATAEMPDFSDSLLRGCVLEEPKPDLASLIAQWKAEQAARDAAKDNRQRTEGAQNENSDQSAAKDEKAA